MRILDTKTPGLIYGLMGNINVTTNNSNCSIISDYKFSLDVDTYLNSPKASKSLQMVMLNDSYLSKTIKDLTDSEIIKINLAHALIQNKEYLVLDYFDKYLTNNEKTEFKRLFKKISQDYHKTIILFTNDLTFLWDIVTTIIYVDNEEFINSFSKKDIAILNYVDNPPISEFISLVKNKNIKIDNYQNTSDLLKAIYRIKE